MQHKRQNFRKRRKSSLDGSQPCVIPCIRWEGEERPPISNMEPFVTRFTWLQAQCVTVVAAAFVPLLQVFWDKKIKRWRSDGDQTAKYSRCVPVRARLSRTTSPALAVPCNWGENKDRNYMFIFDNNFNLLCSPSRSETPTKSRWESVLLRLKVRQHEITESTWCICQFLLLSELGQFYQFWYQ